MAVMAKKRDSKANDPVDAASDILKATNKQFVIIAEGKGNKGLEVRQRFSYMRGLAMLAVIAESLMDDYVEIFGYIVHEDLRNVLENTIRMNEKQPNEELIEKWDEELKELFKNARDDELTRSISSNANISNDDVRDMIYALRCCAEQNCSECPKLNQNEHTLYCSQALMIEARLMLKEFADGTRKAWWENN